MKLLQSQLLRFEYRAFLIVPEFVRILLVISYSSLATAEAVAENSFNLSLCFVSVFSQVINCFVLLYITAVFGHSL